MRIQDGMSPLELQRLLIPAIRGRVVADIGCGNGVHAYILRSVLSAASSEPMRFYGVDFSPKAVASLRKRGLFDKVYLATSTRLPLPDKCVDTALCIENLEHLYSDQVVPAIRELGRIARQRIVITTPWPRKIASRRSLMKEIAGAALDPVPISDAEFRELEGGVHKSGIVPASMLKAGFSNPIWDNSREPMSVLYLGDPDHLDLSKIRVFGMAPRKYGPSQDHRQDYLDLVKESLDLTRQAVWQWRMAAVHALAALRLGKAALGVAVNGLWQTQAPKDASESIRSSSIQRPKR